MLASGEPERLYSGLSLLVSGAVGGEACAGLASFRGLELLLADDLFHQGIHRGEEFARSLLELRDMALELEALTIYACSASVETTALDISPLAGVMSTPRFLERAAGARLLFV